MSFRKRVAHHAQKDACPFSAQRCPIDGTTPHSTHLPVVASEGHSAPQFASLRPTPLCFPEAQCLLAHLSPEATEPAAPKAEWLSPDTVAISRDAPGEMLSPESFGIEERHDVDVEGREVA